MDSKLFISDLEKNPAKHISELEERPGEVWFDKLTDGEKFQVMTRYFNDFGATLQSTLKIVADLYVLIEIWCKKNGIDVEAERTELLKMYQAASDQELKDSIEKLKNN